MAASIGHGASASPSKTEALVIASHLGEKAERLEKKLEVAEQSLSVGCTSMGKEVETLEAFGRAQALAWIGARAELSRLREEHQVLRSQVRLLGRRVEDLLDSSERERLVLAIVFGVELARLERT
jgi:prefoldin subunit 5